MSKGDLTVPQVAEKLGVTTGRVIAMIRQGRLPATKFGPVWVIRERDLESVMNRKVGRPKENK